MTQTVLVVDDELDGLKIMSFFLERNGFNVIKASNANAALLALEQTTPDLIITDLMMPDMDGIELSRAIRARRETHRTPIILRSNHASIQKFVDEAKEAGVNDVRELGFSSWRELLAAVRGLLPEEPSGE